jgi:hypothetical protein
MQPSNVTQGQAMLAQSYARDLCDETYMAMIGNEGAPNREAHIHAAREKLMRIAELLGVSDQIKNHEAA